MRGRPAQLLKSQDNVEGVPAPFRPGLSDYKKATEKVKSTRLTQELGPRRTSGTSQTDVQATKRTDVERLTVNW